MTKHYIWGMQWACSYGRMLANTFIRGVLHGVGADGVGVKFPIFAVDCSCWPLSPWRIREKRRKKKKKQRFTTWKCTQRLFLEIGCKNDTLAVVMFLRRNGCSLWKFFAISPTIQKITSDCGCDAVVHSSSWPQLLHKDKRTSEILTHRLRRLPARAKWASRQSLPRAIF